MNKIEHIGIAVKDLEKSNLLYAKLFGEPHYKIEEVKSESVKTSFFKVGHNKIELLEATDDNSAIAKFIDRKGEGIHHIAFDVDDIEKEIKMISAISDAFLKAESIEDFDRLIIEHERIISSIIKVKPVKEKLFSDYFGEIKSLGAWGGDFVLATGNSATPAYFKNKGFETILTYSEMVL